MPTILKHPTTNNVIQLDDGFNLFAFFFTPIWGLVKGVYLHAILYIVLAIGGFFHFWTLNLIYAIIAGINASKWEQDALIKKGYEVVSEDEIKMGSNNDLSRLEKLNSLKESGAITEEEFLKEKSQIIKGA